MPPRRVAAGRREEPRNVGVQPLGYGKSEVGRHRSRHIDHQGREFPDV